MIPQYPVCSVLCSTLSGKPENTGYCSVSAAPLPKAMVFSQYQQSPLLKILGIPEYQQYSLRKILGMFPVFAVTTPEHMR